MIVVTATLPIDPEKRADALERISDLVEHCQDDDGTLEYRAATDVDDPNLIRFFECYEDEAALEAHTQTEHYQAFSAALPELLAGKPEITRYEVESATDVEL